MLKRSSKTLVKSIVEQMGKEPDDGWCTTLQKKNPAAVAPGRLGGLKGGKARGGLLTPERRQEIAQKAAEARWKK